MSVTHAFLGLLDGGPQHGYRLKQDYDRWFGEGRSLKFGQVYSTLARLERDGMTPVLAVDGGSLTLTAIVRTNNSKLTIVGEAVAELTGTWSTSGVTSTAVGVSQTGVPEGCERRKFSVEIGAGSKKFLRLRSTLAP